MNDQLQTAKDWLGDLSKIVSRQKTKEDYEYAKKRTEALGWLIKRVEELENRNKELEYASKYNGELNEFLQKRKLPPSTLGRHVVDVVMEYVEELEEEVNHWKSCTNSEQKIAAKAHKRVERVEKENRRLKQVLVFYADESNYEFETIVSDCDIDIEAKILDDGGEKARQGLKGESQ